MAYRGKGQTLLQNGIVNHVPCLLRKHDLSYKHAARLSGLKRYDLYKIATGRRRGISFGQLHALSRLFDVNIDKLFSVREEN